MSLDPEPPDPPELAVPPVDAAVAADQAAAHATGAAGHHGPFHTHCENCATPLAGPYCHHCGQHDFEFHRSFWHVFLEGLESFLHFDSKLFHTVATLCFRPGRLTAAFNAGKRASQMPPLRLYIFVSLAFFFLFFLDNHTPDQLVGGTGDAGSPTRPADAAEIKQAWRDVGTAFTGESGGKRTVDRVREAAEKTRVAAQAEPTPAAEPPGAADGVNRLQIRTVPVEGPDSPFLHWLQAQGQRASDPAQQRLMVDKFLHGLPKMLLICLPFFALYTRVLFRRAGLVYLQHLVLALHFHTLIFLWAMLRDGWGFLADLASPSLAGLLRGVFSLWLFLYPFLMFRHLFAGSWVKTIIKTGLLAGLYACTLMLAAMVSGFIIFALL